MNALRGALWPRISRWDKIGETGLIEMSLSRALTYSLILAIPLFVGGALAGDKLLYFFYGAEFENYPTLIILFLVQIVNSFQYFFETYLSAMNQLKGLFMITVVAICSQYCSECAVNSYNGHLRGGGCNPCDHGKHAILAGKILSRRIAIRLVRSCLLNIFKASVVMGVVVGGVVYGVLLIKLDKKIYEELKGIMIQMNVA